MSSSLDFNYSLPVEKTPGTLLVVGTPLGNLEDFSPRARESLRNASAIYCEDTRVTAKLAARMGIGTPRISCHEHNEEMRIPSILSRLAAGETVALVSDAGMPAISDPGRRVVEAASRSGHRVLAIPGGTAESAALAVSGLPAVPHVFLGFLPARQGARRALLDRYRAREETIVAYEAPHRILPALQDALEVLGDRPASLSREITKLHEETIRGPLSEIHARLAAGPAIRGEITVVIGGAVETPASDSRNELEARLAEARDDPRPPREIAREIARSTGESSRAIYARLLRLRGRLPPRD
jgi:16S rRNA (cytidine1402-2'-O)-methyltransferase